MQQAAFSITNYQFNKVEIDITNHKTSELSLLFETSGEYKKEESIYELTLAVHVFNAGEKESPFVMVQCKGIFSFDNVASFEEIPDFFYKNSIAILFPYVRAYISLVTTQANVPGVILPTLNLSSFEAELRKNTTQN